MPESPLTPAEREADEAIDALADATHAGHFGDWEPAPERHQYTATWSMTFEASTPRSAAKQAAASIDDAQRDPANGASVLFVARTDDPDQTWAFDEWGFGAELPW